MRPRPKKIGGDTVFLIPATEDSLSIAIAPGTTSGIDVAITVATANLGNFVIPLTAAQVAVLAVVGKRLLAMDERQAETLRDELGGAINKGDTDE